MASLDPPTRRALLADLQQIFARLSMAVLWVTHDTEEAHAVADRVTFLAAGRVLQEGSRGQVFDTPASVEVADYLGIDVWLEGVVVNGIGGASRLVLPGGAGLVCPETDPGPAFACIHPEDVILFLAPPESSETSLRNIVKAQVQATRRVGRSMLVTLHWEEDGSMPWSRGRPARSSRSSPDRISTRPSRPPPSKWSLAGGPPVATRRPPVASRTRCGSTSGVGCEA